MGGGEPARGCRRCCRQAPHSPAPWIEQLRMSLPCQAHSHRPSSFGPTWRRVAPIEARPVAFPAWVSEALVFIHTVNDPAEHFSLRSSECRAAPDRVPVPPLKTQTGAASSCSACTADDIEIGPSPTHVTTSIRITASWVADVKTWRDHLILERDPEVRRRPRDAERLRPVPEEPAREKAYLIVRELRMEPEPCSTRSCFSASSACAAWRAERQAM